MKAMIIREATGLDALSLVERPDLQPGPGQVVIRVRSVSLNYRDLLIARGIFPFKPSQSESLVPVSDGVGIVEAIGEGVTRFQVGDRVSSIFAQSWLGGDPQASFFASQLGGPLAGLLAEQAVFDQEGLVAVPSYLTDDEAATLPCAAVTAWNALFVDRPLNPGETVLVQGTGGVSLFAAQFAKMAGARVIITSSSDAKLERARALGVWETINYRTTPEWGRRVQELTQGVGADHIIEVGGSGTFQQTLEAIRFGGNIAIVGFLSGMRVELDLLRQLQRQAHITPIAVGSRQMFETMNLALALHEIHPAVDRIFPFEEAVAALQYLESGAHFGKVVIRVA